MKDIMARESSTEDQGVPSLTYSPADADMPLLFSLQRPLEALKDELMNYFAGKELCLAEIYERHSVDTPYILRNYRQTLRTLEDKGDITVSSIKGVRRKGTYPDHVKVKFPLRRYNG